MNNIAELNGDLLVEIQLITRADNSHNNHECCFRKGFKILWCRVRAVVALSALTQSQEASTDTIVIVIDDALSNTASASLEPGLTASIGIKPVY